MKEKEFLINKINSLLYSFDVLSLNAILKALKNLNRRREENAIRRK